MVASLTRQPHCFDSNCSKYENHNFAILSFLAASLPQQNVAELPPCINIWTVGWTVLYFDTNIGCIVWKYYREYWNCTMIYIRKYRQTHLDQGLILASKKTFCFYSFDLVHYRKIRTYTYVLYISFKDLKPMNIGT